MSKDLSTIIQIDDCLISSDILTVKYSCDYQKCKGCCCIIGDSGAPLEDVELDVLENEFSTFKKYMTNTAIQQVEQRGYYYKDSDGDMVTPLINNEECAYTIMEDENCLCAIERAYLAGETEFRKPISCWLYPIRISRLSNGMIALNLHRWNICSDAFIKGEKEGMPVYKFLKEPIIHFLGERFYEALDEIANSFSAT